jgi:hypothetical protein
VDVDVRRVGRVVVGVCLVAVAVVAVVLFVAGAHKNSQINLLRRHGVPVEATVSRCLGLLGGSGSNAAGYTCKGTFTIDGHRYNEVIPGNTLYPPGARIRAVAVPGNPPLLSTTRAVESEQASWRVFILPTVLLAVLVLLVTALALRRRRGPEHSGGAEHPSLPSNPAR